MMSTWSWLKTNSFHSKPFGHDTLYWNAHSFIRSQVLHRVCSFIVVLMKSWQSQFWNLEVSVGDKSDSCKSLSRYVSNFRKCCIFQVNIWNLTFISENSTVTRFRPGNNKRNEMTNANVALERMKGIIGNVCNLLFYNLFYTVYVYLEESVLLPSECTKSAFYYTKDNLLYKIMHG